MQREQTHLGFTSRAAGPLSGRAACLATVLLLAFSNSSLGGVAQTNPSSGKAKVLLTVDEALKLAFPGCDLERTTAYLTKIEAERAVELAKAEVRRRVVYPYLATRTDEAGKTVQMGAAWFDTHRVRTHTETVMVVVNPDGTVRRVELLAFAEPEEYIPRGNWYGQFNGKRLGPGLSLKRDIHGVSGATLTARATTRAVRRTLALRQVLAERTSQTPTP